MEDDVIMTKAVMAAEMLASKIASPVGVASFLPPARHGKAAANPSVFSIIVTVASHDVTKRGL